MSEEIRSQFPIFERDIVYLDTAATAQKPKCVIEAISHFYAHEYATVHRGVYSLAQKAGARYEGVREQVRTFFSGDQVIFTRGATDAINLVATSFCQAFLEPGDEILLSAGEHHSNLVPWQMAAERFGLVLKFASLDANGDLVDFKACLTEKTRLVALPHISNTTGAIHPVEEIIALCQKRGIYTLIDGAQSAAHLPINLEKMGCDFFVASVHKLYGPTGLGFLIGKKELLEKMPPFAGGGDMIDEVDLDHSSYALPPLRFEAGTPMIAQVIGFGAALDFLQSIGMEKIAARESQLTDYLVETLSKIENIKITTNPKRRGGLVTFVVEGAHSLDVAALLDARGICVRSGHLCAQTALDQVHNASSVLRASVGIYTSEADIDRLGVALHEIALALT